MAEAYFGYSSMAIVATTAAVGSSVYETKKVPYGECGDL